MSIYILGFRLSAFLIPHARSVVERIDRFHRRTQSKPDSLTIRMIVSLFIFTPHVYQRKKLETKSH